MLRLLNVDEKINIGREIEWMLRLLNVDDVDRRGIR